LYEGYINNIEESIEKYINSIKKLLPQLF
jgi:hypothetical protein